MHHARVAVAFACVLVVAACTAEPSESDTTGPAAASTTITFTPGDPGVGDSYYPGLGNGGYDVAHYDLDLIYRPNEPVRATVHITAVATQNLSGFNLDFAGWDIERLSLDGHAVDHRRDGDELVIAPVRLTSGSRFEIAITYSGSPTPRRSAAFPADIGWLTGPENEQFVIAEPDAAHSWFPSNDHPLDKATFSFTVNVPRGFLAASNGTLTATDDHAESTTYRWTMGAPMAPYLATVVIGEGWQIVTDPKSSEVAGRPVRNVLPADLAGGVPDALSLTGEMIRVLEGRFGPYPFDRYGIAVVDGFPTALENQTLSIFGRSMVAAPFFEYVLVHELAHQWFGNSVSVGRWSDIWLNEGFATFAELLWVEHLHGDAAYREEVANRIDAARAAEYGPPGTPSPDDLFNRTVYQRGAFVLVALRAEVGDQTFFEILRTHAERFADGNATTDDFIMLSEEVAQRDLTALFSAWLFGDELPPAPLPSDA